MVNYDNWPCLRMRKCCFCLSTGSGTVATAIASIAASIVSLIFIILGFVYWDEFSAAIKRNYDDQFRDLEEDTKEGILSWIWWGNIFSVIVILVYIVFCFLLIVGVQKESHKHLIPWMSASIMIIPFFISSFFIQLIFGLIAGTGAVIIPAVLVLFWCVFWAWGLFCVISHYRFLKGELRWPVATWNSKNYNRPETDY